MAFFSVHWVKKCIFAQSLWVWTSMWGQCSYFSSFFWLHTPDRPRLVATSLTVQQYSPLSNLEQLMEIMYFHASFMSRCWSGYSSFPASWSGHVTIPTQIYAYALLSNKLLVCNLKTSFIANLSLIKTINDVNIWFGQFMQCAQKSFANVLIFD